MTGLFVFGFGFGFLLGSLYGSFVVPAIKRYLDKDKK